ncbi:hypothetical protein GEOBRER4_n2075 [Citrifermentans bremense]|uniref:Uncharacterized protein n=1 Tax=Citrifermentans bremense TaxID=60035 RepID=A0A6S6M0W2_9BACT|nr:hypothetical protein [Citrifermentans bremense]BCG47248.1 hypothetical protein GEOBRER4_n2075 [Citrifermentans bremense]
MTRTIEFELEKFQTVPTTLIDPGTGVLYPTLNVELKKLFHHYFLAKYGNSFVDPGFYEYQNMMTAGPDWRFLKAGIGADKESKNNASNELGKAFARWFHSEHLGMVYFCPFEDVLDKINPDGSVWRKKEKGDLPDYVCGTSSTDVNLLEAKGRYRSVTFKTKEFHQFRAQIQRAQLLDAAKKPLQVKGFISVARWASEKTPRVNSKLLVEDPVTDGRPPSQDGYPLQVGLAMVTGHYASIFDKLELRLQAEAIRHHRPMPKYSSASRGIWECVSGPLSGHRFVGGIVSTPYIPPQIRFINEYDFKYEWHLFHQTSPFILERPATFFGLDERIFRQVIRVSGNRLDAANEIKPIIVPDETGSLSLLRDGSILGPVDYFRPVDIFRL